MNQRVMNQRVHNQREQREQIHKLRQRGADILQEHKRISEHNANIEQKILRVQNKIKHLRNANVELAEKIEEELIKEKTFAFTNQKLEREVQNLEQSHAFQSSRYHKKMARTENLERELEKLTAKKKAYIKYCKRVSGNEAALDIRAKNLENILIAEDKELKSMESSQIPSTPSQEESLEVRIRRLSGKDLKTGSVLYNCLQRVISNIKENEFDGLSFKTRINKNKKNIGARVLFQNVNSQYGDLHEQLGPLVSELGTRFKGYGVKINTKVKKNPNGIVSAIDVTIVLDLPRHKEALASL